MKKENTADEKRTATATWSIECEADCPYCGESIDLLYNGWMQEQGIQAGQNCEMDMDVDCENCEKEFKINYSQH